MTPSRKHGKFFVCGQCGKKLSGDRSRHMKLHSADKDVLKWSCATCGFADLQKHNVVQHYIRTHTVDQPYDCDLRVVDGQGHTFICSFKCQSSSALTKHKRDVHAYNFKGEKRGSAARSRKLLAYEHFVVPPRSSFDNVASANISRSSESFLIPPRVPTYSGLPSSVTSPRRRPDPSPLITFPVPPSSSAASQYPAVHPAVAFQVSVNQLSGIYPTVKAEPYDVQLSGPYTTSTNTWAASQYCHQDTLAASDVFIPQPQQPWGPYQVPSLLGPLFQPLVNWRL